MDIFDEVEKIDKGGGDIFDQVATTSDKVATYSDPGEMRQLKRSVGGDVKNALIGGAFGNVFLRNNPNPEDEKRRQLLSSMVNTATFGAPEAIAGGMGSKMAPVKAPLQSGVGTVLGMAAPAGLANMASKVVTGTGVGANILRNAIQGGVFGVSMPGNVKERGKQGAWGAGLGAGISLVANIAPRLINLGGRKTAQAIAEKADKGMNSLSQGLSKKYDDLFAGIKGTTKVDDILNSVDETIAQFPEGANVGKLNSISARLKKLKDAGEEISATELHNLKQEISKTIPKSVWNGVADGDGITNAKEQIYWKISGKLEELGGDKYKGLTEEYKNFKQSERLARKMFYRQGVPSNLPVGGALDIPTQKAIGRLSSQLPDKEKFAQQFEAWRRGKSIKNVAVGSGLTYAGYELLRRLIPRE